MWRNLYDLAKRLLNISENLQQNRADIKEIQEELRLLGTAVQQLHHEIQSVRQELQYVVTSERQERKTEILQIENAILRSGARLPHKTSDEE
jgi:chromosome segregation ATPase